VAFSWKRFNQTILCGALLLLAAWTLGGAEISAKDADDRLIILNAKERITVVLSSHEGVQEQTRQIAKSLDNWRGRTRFRLIVVVDLSNSFGRLLPGYVKKRMRQDLDREADRLLPIYAKNKAKGSPRPDLCAVPDFTGALTKQLGWPKSQNKVSAIIYDTTGRITLRWDDSSAEQTLVKGVRRLF
jgi:hypothetical protein